MESLLHISNIFLFGMVVEDLDFKIPKKDIKGRKMPGGKGDNNQLGDQKIYKDSRFARIYACSYEGAFYELPWPVLFLVRGEGDSVTDGNLPKGHWSRAPTDPSKTGLPTTDFQFSDDVKYWRCDKSDYTIRMDVETGMFEQVLLDAMFGGAGANVRGADVRGADVRGADVRGADVRGAKVRGADVRGAKVRGGGG